MEASGVGGGVNIRGSGFTEWLHERGWSSLASSCGSSLEIVGLSDR